MKKILSIILAFAVMLTLMCGCSSDTQKNQLLTSGNSGDSDGFDSSEIPDSNDINQDTSNIEEPDGIVDDSDDSDTNYVLGNAFYVMALKVTDSNIFGYGLDINGYNDRGFMNLSVGENTVYRYNYTDISLGDIHSGDIIAVTSVGYVMEVYPSTYMDVIAVNLRTEAENMPDYDPLYGETESVDYTLNGEILWMYSHGGRCHIGMYDYDYVDDYCEIILPQDCMLVDVAVGDTVSIKVDSVLYGKYMTRYNAAHDTAGLAIVCN